jgi:putative ABC transport system permease protein
MMSNLLQDLRFGLRMLAKNPGFTVVAVLTLALGIGANTAIFSVANAVLLRRLAYKDPDRLVWVTVTESISYWGTARVWRPDSTAWREQNQVLERIAAFDEFHGFNLTGGSAPVRVRAMRVTSDFFPLLGIPPARGRTFLPEESQPGQEQVAVLSHSLWQRTFGSDPLVVGKSVALDGLSFKIIGVMPSTFKNPCPGQFDIWLPLPDDPSSDHPGNSVNLLRVLGRLKTGVPAEAVQANLEAITRRLDREYPPTMAASHSKQRVKIIPLHEQLVGDSLRPLFVLLGVVSFVLLIACANVANLLLARATASRSSSQNEVKRG